MTPSRTVLIRADAGPRIGRGHVVRQISLARALADRSAEVRFISAGRPDPLIAAAGFESIAVSDELPSLERPWSVDRQLADADATIAAAGGSVDAVIVDHYGLDRAWDSRARPIAGQLVAVSDLATTARDVDRLVDHNWYGTGSATRYAELLPAHCRTHIGPRYTLLQRAYRDLRAHRPTVQWPPQRVLVSFGGTDPGGETARAVAALSATEVDAGIDVVVGNPGAVTGRLRELVAADSRVALHVAVPTLAPLLARADLSVGASGAATWERMCLRVPSVVTTTAPDQSGVTRALDDAGLVVWAGLVGEVPHERYIETFARLLEHGPPCPPDLVDGWGTDRVAALICPSGQPQVALVAADARSVPAHLSDSDQPQDWRRDEAAFGSDLSDPDVHRLTLLVDGIPTGWIRGSIRGDAVRVTGGVDPAAGLDQGVLAALASSGRWRRSRGHLDFEPARVHHLDFDSVGSSAGEPTRPGGWMLPLHT